MAKLTIHYVDAPAGTGKTRAAVERMRRHICPIRDVRSGYILYVAPTCDLLSQTIEYLKKRLPEDKHQYLFSAFDKNDFYEPAVLTRALNTLNGKLEGRKFKEGSVLFLTHATFLALREHPKFARTTVYFDESRKWTDMVGAWKLTPSAEKLFNKIFTTEPLPSNSGVDDVARLVPTTILLSDATKKGLTKGEGKIVGQLEELRDRLVEKKGLTARMSAYCQISTVPTKGSKKGKTESETKTKVLMEIVLPSQPFRGFRKVYILSASFKRSQMYHLLKLEGCHAQNSTEQFMRILKGGYHKALARIRERYSKVVLLPLINHSTGSSLTMYRTGLLVPRRNLEKVRAEQERIGLSIQSMRKVVLKVRKPTEHGALSKDQESIKKVLLQNKAVLDIMKWQMQVSKEHATFLKNKADPKWSPALIVTNKNFSSMADDTSLLNVMSLGKVEGRNDFMNTNLVAYLGAINPNPLLRRMLGYFIPAYDPNEDYAGMKTMQAICRGNARDHTSDEKMYAIVPTTGTAEIVATLMDDLPTVLYPFCEDLGDYIPYTGYAARSAAKKLKDSRPESEESAAHRASIKSKAQKTYRAKNQKMTSLRVQLSKAKKKLAADPTNKALSDKLRSLLERKMEMELSNAGAN